LLGWQGALQKATSLELEEQRAKSKEHCQVCFEVSLPRRRRQQNPHHPQDHPAAEVNAVGPASVLVIPEGSTGDYDIILESSTDMVTWTPFHSQTLSSTAPTNLFRTRIVKKEAP
jgi:hypothetical protein